MQRIPIMNKPALLIAFFVLTGCMSDMVLLSGFAPPTAEQSAPTDASLTPTPSPTPTPFDWDAGPLDVERVCFSLTSDIMPAMDSVDFCAINHGGGWYVYQTGTPNYIDGLPCLVRFDMGGGDVDWAADSIAVQMPSTMAPWHAVFWPTQDVNTWAGWLSPYWDEWQSDGQACRTDVDQFGVGPDEFPAQITLEQYRAGGEWFSF